MRIVLDASAAVELVLNLKRASEFTALLEEAAEVLAPDLILTEVVNAFWKYHHFENLSVTACDRGIESAAALVDTFVSAKELYREAFLLARTAQRPAYDMFYLALARQQDATLLTADTRLRKEAERQGVRVA